MAVVRESDVAGGLEIRLLGSLEIRVHGTVAPPPRTSKGHWLLALLALRHGQSVARSWLAGTLWPESTEERALSNLRRSLTDVRDLLGAEARRLQPEKPRGLRLDLDGADCDVLSFDGCIEQGDAAALERAVALYRGPLLESCTEDWVFSERAAREEAYLLALERLAGHAIARGEPGEAVRYLRGVVATDPLRESAHRRLMEALAASGDYPAVTQVYRDLRLLLHREINGAPSPETSALFERIAAEQKAGLRAAGASPVTPPAPPRLERSAGRLPQPLSSMVGREREAVEVCERLATTRLVTLTGAGGVGKTRLAIRVAGEIQPQFPDGIRFVDLTPLADPALVPHLVATALGLQEAPGQPLFEVLAEHLQSRALLLVLDNCEHVVAAAAALAHTLLAAAPDLRILATSRQALEVAGEVAWRVPSLAVPGNDTPAPEAAHWQEYAALRLFVERASQARSDFVPTPQNLPLIARICRDLDGIPLAIELAAARLKALSTEHLAARLDDRLNLLASNSSTAPPRHRTLRAALEWSYASLSEPERTLLHRLAVFTGGWTLETAEAVCADTADEGSDDERARVAPGAVLDLLTQLVGKSLVVYEEEHGAGRYRLLETVRQFSRERLAASGEEAAQRRRHATYFRELAVALRPRLIGAEQTATLRRFDSEHGNLRAALDWHYAEAAPETEFQVLIPMIAYWVRRGHISEGRRRVEAALARPEAVPITAERARMLLGAGTLASVQDESETVRRYYEECLPLLVHLDMRAYVATCLNNLGNLERQEGNLPASWELLEEALTINQALGDIAGQQINHHNLGCTAHAARDYEAAQTHWEAALRLSHEIQDLTAQASNMLGLGEVAWARGDNDRAYQLAADALEIVQQTGDIPLTAEVMHTLALLTLYRGEWEAANAWGRASLELLAEIANRPRVVECLATLARVAAGRGELERAATLFGAVEVLSRAGRYTSGIASWEATGRDSAQVRSKLGQAAFESAASTGRGMNLDRAVSFAIQGSGAAHRRDIAASSHTAPASDITATPQAVIRINRPEAPRRPPD